MRPGRPARRLGLLAVRQEGTAALPAGSGPSSQTPLTRPASSESLQGINCVVHKLDGPKRLNKTGRRVEEAKRTLGSVDYGSSTPAAAALAPPSTASGPPPSTTGITDAELDEILRSLAPDGGGSSFAWQPPPLAAQQQQQQPFGHPPAALPVISLSSAAHQLQVKTLEATMEQDLLQTFFTKVRRPWLLRFHPPAGRTPDALARPPSGPLRRPGASAGRPSLPLAEQPADARFHTSSFLQAVDPESFRTMYNAHLRNPSFMSPVNQTICAFMAAWGARCVLSRRLFLLRP